MNLFPKQKEMHRHRKLMVTKGERGWREGQIRRVGLTYTHDFIYIYFLLFRAIHAAYRGSQARDPIRTFAAGLCHSQSNIRSELRL